MSAFRVALVALSVAVLTAACAAGEHAATSIEKPSIDGTQGQVGTMQLAAVAIRPPAGKFYPNGADVPMRLSIINNGHSADTLTKVSSPAFPGGWAIVPTGTVASAAPSSAAPSSAAPAAPSAGTPQSIGAGSAVSFGLDNLTPAGGASPDTLVLKGLTTKSAPLYPGTTVKITFTFAKAGDATLTVPVQITTKPNTASLPISYSPPAG